MSILEAMAAGLPVIATAVGGVPELVHDGVTGLLVPPRDPASFAAAIGSLLGDPVLREKMGSAGRTRVQTVFDLQTFLDAHRESYRTVLSDRGIALASI